MKLIPDFLAERLKRKPSENFIRASKRARQRQARELNFDGLFQDTSKNNESHQDEKSSKSSRMDVKTLVMAVSIVVNAGLAGVLYGKSSSSDENEHLRSEVASLRAEKAKISRASEGKITLAPNQRIITVEEIQNFTTAAQSTVDSTKTLIARVAELEGRLAKYEGKKRASATESPSVSNEPASAPVPARDSATYSKALETVKAVSQDLPEGVFLKVSQNGGLTTVTYSDTSGFTRYFTANRSENASKLTLKGLRTWMSEKYMASLDIQAAQARALR